MVYLELLAVIQALKSSESITHCITRMDKWLRSAEIVYPEGARHENVNLPIEPL